MPPAGPHRVTIIWLHGLGADGRDFEPIIPALRLPDALGIRFLFPEAPFRPVTINGGMEMRAWFDIESVQRDTGVNREHLAESVAGVRSLVAQEAERGIPADRVVLAGFSQGGAVVLQAATCAGPAGEPPIRPAGVVALSTYLPVTEGVASRAGAARPHLSGPRLVRSSDPGPLRRRELPGPDEAGVDRGVPRIPDGAPGRRGGDPGHRHLPAARPGNRGGRGRFPGMSGGRIPVTLITGAAGEIGQALLQRLADGTGDPIVTVDLRPLSTAGPGDRHREHFQGDILDPALWERLRRPYRPTLIFHLAAILSTRAESVPVLAHRVNADGAARLLAMAADLATPDEPVRFVFPSSIAVYGLPSREAKEAAAPVSED